MQGLSENQRTREAGSEMNTAEDGKHSFIELAGVCGPLQSQEHDHACKCVGQTPSQVHGHAMEGVQP